MNTEYLLKSTYGKKEMSIDLDIIKEIGEFQTGEDVCSIESVLLILNKHQPVKRNRFDVARLKVWCEQHDFIHYIDELNRVVHFKRIEKI